MKILSKVIDFLFSKLANAIDRRNRKMSYTRPVIRGRGRDAFSFYENGRSVRVEAELMARSSGVDRIVYRDCLLKWDDDGKPLNPAQRERVLQEVGKFLDRKGVKWKFGDVRGATNQ